MAIVTSSTIKVTTNLLILLFALFTQATAQIAGMQKNIQKQELSQKKFSRMLQKENTIILDVRTAEEYNEGHLANAVLMDYQIDDFLQIMESLDKSKTYLIYCKSGRRSKKALELFNRTGFASVYHLKGGYSNWKQKNKK